MVVQEFDLNLIPSSAPVIIHVDQYDKGDNRLLIHLYDGDTPYVPETAATVEIQGVKPDTKGFQYYADIDGSTVTADVVMQMTACAGRVKTQIVVTETTGRTGTFDFILDVQESALPAIVDISETELPIIIEGAQAQADAAAASAAQAAASEQLAAEHIVVTAENANRAKSEADRAEAEADRAKTSREIAEDAEAWAVGERGGVPVEEGDETYENNAKWYSEQIGTEKEDAEAWAKGTRNGEPVSEDDPTYHNNSKYWSDKSGTSRLVSLDDVDITSPDEGDILHYDETEEKWVNDTMTVGKLADTSIVNLQDGESLVYDGETGKWINRIASAHLVPKPVVSGFTFTYDGTEQGPTITGLPEDWNKYITITDATAINAGEYELRFSLKNTTIYTWADATTQDITYNWEIEKIPLTVPTVTASLTYNGSPQSPIITGFDSTTMTKTGDVETNAGNHNVTFSLVDPIDYEWSDETTADKLMPWSIAKAAGAITLSANSVTLDSTHLSVDVTFSGETGTVTTTSSAATIATASVTGSTITVETVNRATGTATITVSVAESQNYLATSATITVSAEFFVRVTVTMHGARGATITFTDGNGAQTVTLDSQGEMTGVSITCVPNSQITFTDTNVAKDPDNLTNPYTKTVTITSGMTDVYVMPDNTIYWYGTNSVGVVGLEAITTGNGWTSTAKTANNLSINLTGSSSGWMTATTSYIQISTPPNTLDYAGMGTKQSVDLTNLNKICVVYMRTGGNSGNLSPRNAMPTENNTKQLSQRPEVQQHEVNPNILHKIEQDISSVSGNRNITYGYFKGSTGTLATIKIYAVYLSE